MSMRHETVFVYSEMTVNPSCYPRQLASFIYFNLPVDLLLTFSRNLTVHKSRQFRNEFECMQIDRTGSRFPVFPS